MPVVHWVELSSKFFFLTYKQTIQHNIIAVPQQHEQSHLEE
jgi:hypothetical protein